MTSDISSARSRQLTIRALQNMPLLLLVVVFLVFSALDPRFFDPDTLINIMRQATYVGFLAIGLTFVLLTAGIDLSVGAIAYLSAVLVADVLAQTGLSVFGIVALMVAIGALAGAVNGVLVGWARIVPFIVTLAAMGVYRGGALGQSQSQEQNYPTALTELGNTAVLGIPLPVILFVVVAAVSHVVLTRTPYGRQVYAVGHDPVAAERAGIRTRWILVSVYVISGAMAGMAAFVAVIQLGTVIPSFGVADEFDAIAAAVLGGASLFGGRGSIFPGTVAGALLVQMINVGLVFMQVDLYVTPMVSAAVIFFAVLVDAYRTRLLDRLDRKSIRLAETEPDSAFASSGR